MLLKYGDCGVTTLPPNNRLELNDGTFLEIDDPMQFCLSGSTASTISLTSGGELVEDVLKSTIIGVFLTIPANGISTDSFCRYLFAGYVNCKTFSLSFSGDAPSSAGNFCFANMFQELPITGSEITGFYIPPEVTSVGNYFCLSMFIRCRQLSALPTEFVLPGWITNAGVGFLEQMFNTCVSLKNVPNLQLPTGLTSIPQRFLALMFANSGIEELPAGVTLPRLLNSIGANACLSMFEASRIKKLPPGFSLPYSAPSGILPNTVFNRMFAGTPIAGLPEGFDLPQDFNGAGQESQYFNEMFLNCPNLQSSETTEGVPIHFFYGSTNIFGGTTPAEPDSPPAGSIVYIIDNTTE